jgi:hypothetical protein
MPEPTKTKKDGIQRELADEKERSGELGKRLEKLAEDVAPEKPAGDDTWKGDVA